MSNNRRSELAGLGAELARCLNDAPKDAEEAEARVRDLEPMFAAHPQLRHLVLYGQPHEVIESGPWSGKPDEGLLEADLLFAHERIRAATLAQLRDLAANLKAISEQLPTALKKASQHEQLGELANRTNELVKRFIGRPWVMHHPGRRCGIEILQYPAEMDRIPYECFALFQTLQKLVEHDELDRLRTCAHCRRWFFAGGRRDQATCTTRCRQAKFDATPGRKKYKRELQRKIYRNLFGRRRRRAKGGKHGKG